MVDSNMRNGGCLRRGVLVSLWVLVLLAAVGCTGVDSTPPPVTTPTPLPTTLMDERPVTELFESPAYGIHISQWWRLDVLERDLALTSDMGFGWVKQTFAWRDIEGYAKGEYDWYRPDEIVAATERAGLNLIVRIDRQPLWAVESLPEEEIKPHQPPVDYQDFGDFCGVLAQRYQGRVAAYQVWNEPNLSREWGDKSPSPTEYTALLKLCYEAIKAADPDAIVISAGLAPTGNDDATAMSDAKFLQGMYEAGAAAYFDVLGVHAPGYKAPPETSPDEAEVTEAYGNGRWFAFRHVEDMRAIMVANGDDRKQVAVLEMGWTLDEVNQTYTWFAVDEATQADYLVRAYQYAADNWRPWIGLMTTIYIADPNWTAAQEQWWWSIVLPDGTPRPAFFALQAMEK